MHALLQEWRQRPRSPGLCHACFQQAPSQFCSSRCQQHFAVLSVPELHLGANGDDNGGMKRVLVIDPVELNDLPDDMVVALLEVLYPARETDHTQFRALAAWRHLSERYRRLIDTRIYPFMTRLPRTSYDFKPNDAALRLFPNLTHLHADSPLSFEAVRQLTRLTALDLDYDNTLSDDEVGQLTTLTRLHISSAAGVGAAEGPCLLSLVALQELEVVDLQLHASWLTSLPLVRLQLQGGDPPILGQLPLLTTLRDLQISADTLDDASLLRAPNLTRLVIVGAAEDAPGRLSDASVSRLTALRELNLRSAERITSRALLTMPELRQLEVDVGHYPELGQLTQLTRLNPWRSRWLTDEVLLRLTELRWLDLSENDMVTDDGLRLPKLEYLRMSPELSADALLHLPRLRSLDMGISHASGAVLQQLPLLTELDVSAAPGIKPSHLLALPRECRVTGADQRLMDLRYELNLARQALDGWLQRDPDGSPFYDPTGIDDQWRERTTALRNRLQTVVERWW